MAAQALLASAARTAAANSDQVRQAAVDMNRGIVLILDVTATPNNGETLTPSVQIYDPISAKYQTLTAFKATKKGEEIGATSTTTTLLYTLYPGASETESTASHEVQALPLPAIWRAVVTPSSTGSWTYSLAYQTLA
jgi:hypothetical protein